MTKGNEIRDVVDGAHGVKKVCPECDGEGRYISNGITQPIEKGALFIDKMLIGKEVTCHICKGSGEV